MNRFCSAWLLLFFLHSSWMHADDKRVLLVARDDGNYTAQGLTRLGVSHTRIAPAAYRDTSPFDYDLIIWGMDEARAGLALDVEQTYAYLDSGGVLLCFRQSDADKWLPVAAARDKAYQFGQILVPEHPIFTTPHALGRDDMLAVHGGSIYRAFHGLGEGWVPLVSTGAPQGWDKSEELAPDQPHYGLIELKVGEGHLLMTQMIPAYHWFHDSKGDRDCAGARFFGNLVTYVLGLSRAEASRRLPRSVPPEFTTDLSSLMPLPCGFAPDRPDMQGWESHSSGPYAVKHDRRGILTVTHADVPSKKGTFCELRKTLPIPRERGRVALRWYVSDTYCGGRERILGGAEHGKTAFVNERKDHRFVQVLVNGRVIWEEDVLGRLPQPARKRFRLADICDYVAEGADSCNVALRVEDRQGSGEGPFAIDVFWGAVELVTDAYRILPAAFEGADVDDEGPARLRVGYPFRFSHQGGTGTFRFAVRLQDRVNDRPTVLLKTGGNVLGEWQLTADDHRWYWAVTEPVELAAGAEFTLSLAGGSSVGCPISEVALTPVGGATVSRGAMVVPDHAEQSRVAETAMVPGPISRDPSQVFSLTVQEILGVARTGEIATQGIPFSRGAVKDLSRIVLTRDNGETLPLQIAPLAYWPDGSIRVALTSFPVDVGANAKAVFSVKVLPKGQASAQTFVGNSDTHDGFSGGLSLRETDEMIEIDTGRITVSLSKTDGRLLDAVRDAEGNVLKRREDLWDLALETETGRLLRSSKGTHETMQVVARGPLRALVVREGSFADDSGEMVDYRIQLEAWAGSDALGIQTIIVNREDSPEVYLKRWSLEMAQDAGVGGTMWLGDSETTPIRSGALLYQHRENRLTWTGTDGACNWAEKCSPGMFQLGDVAVGARWFWQRFPQAIRFDAGGVRFDFIPEAFDERDLPVRWKERMAEMTDRYTVGGVGYPQSPGKIGLFRLAQGEALHQELRFVFRKGMGTDAVPSAMAAMNHSLRAVSDPDYTAGTLAFGEFAPAEGCFPKYEENVEQLYTSYLKKREYRREYGFENFGDDTFEWGYGPSYTYWSNSEYDHHHGFALEYLRSGDTRWWELAEQQARMYRDVVVIHYGPENLHGGPRHHNATSMWMPSHDEQRWVADHTAHGPSCGHSWAQGMIDYWLLTGDPWSEVAVRELADWYCTRVESGHYGAGGQERGPGWTLIAVSALASVLRTERLMAAGNRVADWLVNWQDPMRGVISVPISEQPSYEGGTVFMHGIVGRALGRWYDLTGRPDVRLACIGISEWMTTEPMNEPGRFWYKQSPNNSRRYSATSQSLTALTYAYTLSQDPWFADIALALYRQTGVGSRSISWYPQALAQLTEVVTPAEVSVAPTSVLVAPDIPAEVAVCLRNTTDDPITARLDIRSQGTFGVAVPDSATIPAQTTWEGTLRVTSQKAVTGQGNIAVGIALFQAGKQVKQIERSIRVQVLERLIRVVCESTDAEVVAPMVLDREEGGAFLHTPRDENFVAKPRTMGSQETEGGFALFNFTVPEKGIYGIAADVFWLDGEGNSFYISVDGQEERVLGNSGDMKCWVVVDGGAKELEPGPHRIRIRTREDGARLRRLTISENTVK